MASEHEDGDRRVPVGVGVLVTLISLLFIKLATAAVPESERQTLLNIQRNLGDPADLKGWIGDPCEDNWEGITCDGLTTITEVSLPSRQLNGTLPDLSALPNLTILDFQMNQLSGPLPNFGSLAKLKQILLTGNQISGIIPLSIGNLSALYRLSLDENSLDGPLPETLANLQWCGHLHLNNNSFSGSLPSSLGRMPSLHHLLVDNNKLEGEIPAEIGNISSLTVLKLSGNKFQGALPSSLSQLVNLTEMSVERNGFMGELPNLENVTSLMNLNAHSNQLTGTIPSWIGKLELVMMIDLSSNRLSGGIPESLQNLTNLQVLRLGDNQVNGTIPPSLGHPAQASLRVMWMEQTDLTGPVPSGWTTSDASKLDYAIFETPICEEHPQLGVNRQLCQVRPESSLFSGSSDSGTPENCCAPGTRPLPGQRQCQCVFPLYVFIRLSAPPFRDFDSERILSLRQQVAKDLNLNETQVQVENFTAAGDRLEMALTFYPPEFRSLNAEEMTMIKDGLYTQKVHLGADLGPYVALNYSLPGALIVKEDKGLSTGETAAIITSAVVGGLIVCVAIMYAYNQKKRADYAEHYPAQAISITVGGDDNEPQIQFKGARIFRFEELKRVTNNFSERNVLGKGGYGKVYKGVLRDGEEVAIKRLDKESQQGDREFSTEVALLLRLHHRNLVNLVGFCTEGPEQMLVYEYMPNGTLNEHLNGSRGRTLTCYERLSIAEGAASGLVYLHVHADPPIIHRDIKPGNILLDSRFVAKVADFGLSKLAPDGGTHLVTTVKGTTGYLDPEYYMNNTLSEKSDVFSFGIVLLELFTGRLPIVNGRHILATVQKALDKDSLYEVIDPRIREKCDFNAIEAGIKIALRCTAPASQDRPTMLEVYEELKAIRGRDSSHVSNDSNRSPVSRDNLKSSGYFSKTAEDEQRVKGNARKDPYESDNWPDTFTSSGVTIVNPDITQIAPR